LDAFGDIGGLQDAIHLSLGVFIGLLVEKSFNVEAVIKTFKYIPSNRPHRLRVDKPEDGIITEVDV
jgi:hypothetical protein